MRIDFVYPRLPPTVDGVGDHTHHLATHLCERHEVRVLCARGQGAGVKPYEAVPLLGDGPLGALPLLPELRRRRPDWLLLPYTGFSFSTLYGLTPSLVLATSRRLRGRGTRVALLAHEAYAPPVGPVQSRALGVAQRAQFRRLGRSADVVLLTTESWLSELGSWFPRAHRDLLIVSSNLPRVTTRQRARSQLGMGPDRLMVVVFGGLGSHRDERLLRAGLRAASAVDSDVLAAYVGVDGASFSRVCNEVGVEAHIFGALEAESASVVLCAADIALAPFAHGVSLRRSSFLACLQHSLPTVTTVGPLTGDQLLRAAESDAFVLVPPEDVGAYGSAVRDLLTQTELRVAMGMAAERYFRAHHAWSTAAERLELALGIGPGSRP